MVGKKILILEENGASRKFISNLLRQKQIEALIVAWHDEPDLILLDRVLSDILAGKSFKKIRDNACTTNTQLLLH